LRNSLGYLSIKIRDEDKKEKGYSKAVAGVLGKLKERLISLAGVVANNSEEQGRGNID
jgi:hypothetical protein